MRLGLVGAVTAGGLLLAGCTSEGQAATPAAGRPATVAPVELTVSQPTDEPVRIGLLVTLSAVPGQGSDVLPAAEGAQVAAYRLDLGGQQVELEVVDDRGTVAGARAAVEELVNARVSGIVAATTGEHVLPALEDASAAGTAVLLPYLRTGRDLPSGSFVTGPTAAAVGAALEATMKARGLARAFVVTADGVEAPGVQGVERAVFDGSDTESVTARVRRAARDGAVDSVVVAGSAASQARLVSRLQGTVEDLPVVLTPEALSPVFADQLQAADGTTAARFVTVGVDASDTTTLRSGARADAAASYFAALRMLSEQADARDLFGSVPFAEVAEDADTSSHDAVVALAAAASEAGSTSPAAVQDALADLALDHGDGLAGAALDFSSANALDADAVVELNATEQDPGVRPGLDAGNLFWFAVPTASR